MTARPELVVFRSSCSSALLTASAAAWASDGSIRRAVSWSATEPSVPMAKGWTSSEGAVDVDLVGALRWFLLGALTWAIDPEAQTN